MYAGKVASVAVVTPGRTRSGGLLGFYVSVDPQDRHLYALRGGVAGGTVLTGFARAFKTPDLRKKLLFTLGIIVLYRLGGATSRFRV